MTSRPRCCRCNAAETPTMPAPSTTISALNSTWTSPNVEYARGAVPDLKLGIAPPRRKPPALSPLPRPSAGNDGKSRLRGGQTLATMIGRRDRGRLAPIKPQRRTRTYVGTSDLACGDHGFALRVCSGFGADPALRQPGRPQIAGPLYTQGNHDDRPSRPRL